MVLMMNMVRASGMNPEALSHLSDGSTEGWIQKAEELIDM